MTRTALLTMPRLGETMDSGRIAGWMVSVGERFERGQYILEVETDKTLVEYPALGPGILRRILVEADETVDVGAPLAEIEIPEGPDWTAEAGSEPEADSEPGPARAPSPAPVASLTPAPFAARALGSRATPPARRLAARTGIDLATVSGSGRRGRIEAQDVLAAEDGAAPAMRSAHGVAYAEQGPADGAPVLLIHGFAGDHATFTGLARGLARAGRRVVSIDLPGHGTTALAAARPEDLARPLEAFARELFAEVRVHVVAHSLGALPALALAEAGRVSTMSLIAPAGIGHAIDTAFVRGLAAPSSAGEVAHLLRRTTEGPSGLSEAAIAAIHRTLAQGRLAALADAIVGAAGQSVDILPVLEPVSARLPVRVLIGHGDRIVGWEDALRLPARIAVHHFSGVGHMPHWERPRAVLEILLAVPV